MLEAVPAFRPACGWDSQFRLEASSDPLPPLLLDLPAASPHPEDLRQHLANSHLQYNLQGFAADVAAAGCHLDTTFISPSIWTAPFAAESAVEPLLPDAAGHVGFREVEVLHETEDGMAAAWAKRPHAQLGSRDFYKGSLASTPFPPGGEALEAVRNAAVKAAEQAETGAWLHDFEAGRSSATPAPGLAALMFGAPEEPPASASAGDEVHAEGLAMESGISGASETIGTARADSRDADHKTMKMDDLFSGVWMIEEERDGVSDSGSSLAEEDVHLQQADADGSVLGSMPNLPESSEIPGAIGQDAQGPASTSGRTTPGLDGLLEGADLSKPDWWMAGRMPLLTSPAKRSPRASQGDRQWAVSASLPDLDGAFNRLKPTMARKYPFELDTFQKEAVVHLEQNHSVFVAAHTSAGKTVVAEYAFALAMQHCTRAVYTSPIKTISNQKFRDFTTDKFEVGLLTGDVSIKAEAPCLIMTTEILRSMLYKGADVIRDLEWVIFDEVHYVNDAERGVVWEEVIIMLPAHVNLVLLSATVPNVMEFADWVGRTKRKVVYVAGTHKRPVPLEHSIFYAGQMFPVCRQDRFLPGGITQARLAWKAKHAPPDTQRDMRQQRPTGRGTPPGPQGRGGPRGGTPPGRGGGSYGPRGGMGGRAGGSPGGRGGGGGGFGSDRTQWLDLVNFLGKKEMLPSVVFCFSRKRVELMADYFTAKDFMSAAEKSSVHRFCEKALERLKPADRRLPQIARLRGMLGRGLAVHHAGLLPIVKEIVELLFCKGLIRVLFCTETFAMGVNAPARTVIFQQLRKHDGKAFRGLLSGEYTQMAGRAGRRGLDKVGTVLLFCAEELPEEGELRKLLTGKATQLSSQFRLTYSMILNLLRVEDLKVEDMLKRSFAEFRAQTAAPEQQALLVKGQAALEALRAHPWPHSLRGTSRGEVEQYYSLCHRIEQLGGDVQETVMNSRAAQTALAPGRIITTLNPTTHLSEFGVVIDQAQAEPGAVGTEVPGVGGGLILRAGGKGAPARGPGPLPRSGHIGGLPYCLHEVPAPKLEAISKQKIQVDLDSILKPGESHGLSAAVRQLQRMSQDSSEQACGFFDPLADFRLQQMDLVEKLQERHHAMQLRDAARCNQDPMLGEMFTLVRSQALLEQRLESIAHKLSDAGLQQMPDFNQRIAVLRRMGYIAHDNTVQIKGRVACEVNSGDELVATEVIFAGILTELTPEEAVAVLSAFVFQGQEELEGENEVLKEAREQATGLALQAGQEQKDCGLDIVPEDFAAGALKWGLMEVVYEWAQGTAFEDICKLTDVQEGIIVRTIVRLDETCREFRDAARVMGNTQLFQQMSEASAAIKRDVIFAASLYVA
ncbi:hypothetical protein WJX84_006472 [Apatococcus fuscideae]|uniref:Antiviral helicase SKI2 n=1 Tax=Apatococcus fuscideae TaxID=2026836 RepID=A0AAW1ST09_9CHLO